MVCIENWLRNFLKRVIKSSLYPLCILGSFDTGLMTGVSVINYCVKLVNRYLKFEGNGLTG